ncbi:hypothetical protein GGR33_003070 [Methylobacterium brachythecii]|nr:hypothetical protein [Methylobacterium brachythecii]
MLLAAYPAESLDATARTPVPDKSYRSAKDALRSGVRDYNAGDKQGAVRALEYAADQGQTLALWKLGRMYADGDGVPHDDLKAFEYFSRIADDNDVDDKPDNGNSGVVASAFTSLGAYFLDGIKGTYVRSNPERAYEMFNYAASFGEPNAQYNLARLYLDGNGVEQDPRKAARWFNLAAEKGHKPAQALLGDLLFNGVGVPRQTVRGLTWLALARDGAQPRSDEWIVELYDKAWSAASEADRAEAMAKVQSTGSTRRRR